MKEKRFTYHWVIVLAGFLLMAASIGIVINCFNLFSVSLMSEFGYSASAVQLIFTIAMLASLVGGAVAGKIISKITMRVAMPIYAVLLSGGFFLYSMSKSLSMFYILSIIVGVGASGVSLIPCGVLINNWFHDKKGLATGIAFTGSVVGGLVFVQITKFIIASSGWRSAYMILGIISAAILLPTTIFLVRENPEDKGLMPLGAKLADDGLEDEIRGISTAKFVKTSSFWLLFFSLFFIGLINMGMLNNLSICLTKTMGHSAESAANILSIVMGVQIFGKILLGAIYDKKGIKFGTGYCTVLFVLTVILFMYSNVSYLAIAFGILFGLVGSMTTVTPPYLTALIVGRRNYSTIYGLLSLSYGLGAAMGPVIAGKIYDSTGSYNPAWIAFGVISLIAALTIVLANKKGKGFSQMTV